MKIVRTIPQVLIDAQNREEGILAVKMQEFKFLDENKATAIVSYYKQVETNGPVGTPKYNYEPIPVSKATGGAINRKVISITNAEMLALYQAAGITIAPGDDFGAKLNEALTIGTIIKSVAEEDFAKKNDLDTPLLASEWEVVQTQELIEETE